jgi:hypothetical protein
MSKKLSTPSKIRKEILYKIRQGLDKDAILNIISSEIDETNVDKQSLTAIVTDTINEYPDYLLIQKIKRSKLVVDKNSKEELYYVIDPLNKDIDTIQKTRLLSLFYKPDFSAKTYTSNFIYHPFKPEKLFLDGDTWNFNTYIPPAWKKLPSYIDADLPTVYQEYISHLVDYDKDSYEYILDWLATALQSRNYCILTTIGNQGIGKGVLGTIMEQLVGSDNFSLTDNRLLTKEFNKQMLNKRIVYIDEFKVNNSIEENRIKLLINDKLEIEAKRIDSVNVVNYASIYVSSNDMSAIRLRGDDRRFSIVQLTTKNLNEKFSKSKIESLFNESNIRILANYLMQREIDLNKMNKVFKSIRTEEVRESSLKAWEEWFIYDFCESNKGKELQLCSIADEIENLFGSRSKPSTPGFKRIEEIYPTIFKIIRPRKNGKRIWRIKIFDDIIADGDLQKDNYDAV